MSRHYLQIHGDVASYDPDSPDVFATKTVDAVLTVVANLIFQTRLRGGFIRSNVPSISREPASTCVSSTNPIRHFALQQIGLVEFYVKRRVETGRSKIQESNLCMSRLARNIAVVLLEIIFLYGKHVYLG